MMGSQGMVLSLVGPSPPYPTFPFVGSKKGSIWLLVSGSR